MKRLPFILSLIAVAGVIALFILQFSSCNIKTQESETKEVPPDTSVASANITVPSGDLKVAYVNIDSVLQNYTYYHELKDDLMRKQEAIRSELDTKSKQLQSQALDLQEKYQKGLLTTLDAQEKQKLLQKKQQDFLMRQEQASQTIAEQRQVMLNKIIYRVKQYVNDYNKKAGYHLILSTSGADNILYGASALNITETISKGLNNAYKQENQPVNE